MAVASLRPWHPLAVRQASARHTIGRYAAEKKRAVGCRTVCRIRRTGDVSSRPLTRGGQSRSPTDCRFAIRIKHLAQALSPASGDAIIIAGRLRIGPNRPGQATFLVRVDQSGGGTRRPGSATLAKNRSATAERESPEQKNVRHGGKEGSKKKEGPCSPGQEPSNLADWSCKCLFCRVQRPTAVMTVSGRWASGL